MESEFSKIIAGVMSWGLWGKKFSTKAMQQLIQHCFENGITTFDHADIYGGYTTEAAFGEAFSKTGIPREEVQLISKCGIQYVCDNRNNKVKHYDYSTEYIIWSVEESLKNLKTDYLDLLLLHRPSPLMHPFDIEDAVIQLQNEGKILEFGVSNFSNSQMELIDADIDVDYNQIEFSLTNFSAMNDGTLDYMIARGIQPMAWSPMGSVFKEVTPQTQRIHQQLDALTQKYSATKDQLLLAWILKHPADIIPVIGTTNPTRIRQAMDATFIDLELEDWFLLLVASQGHKVP